MKINLETIHYQLNTFIKYKYEKNKKKIITKISDDAKNLLKNINTTKNKPEYKVIYETLNRWKLLLNYESYEIINNLFNDILFRNGLTKKIVHNEKCICYSFGKYFNGDYHHPTMFLEYVQHELDDAIHFEMPKNVKWINKEIGKVIKIQESEQTRGCRAQSVDKKHTTWELVFFAQNAGVSTKIIWKR